MKVDADIGKMRSWFSPTCTEARQEGGTYLPGSVVCRAFLREGNQHHPAFFAHLAQRTQQSNATLWCTRPNVAHIFPPRFRTDYTAQG